jgi:BirA family biotin operon repressor/biotin-[acetyl-CoA-carboxylase] ligase
VRDAEEGLPIAWWGRESEVWAQGLGIPGLELYLTIPSTNGRIRDLAAAGAPPFTTVISDLQTAGRGRGGRSWHSPPGSGLWLSVLLAIAPDGTAGVLPLAIGVAVAKALERFAEGQIGLKWPNDLLLGPRKVAGILCESAGASHEHVAVGIGINLRRPAEGIPPELEGSAAFLEEVASRPIAEPELTKVILEEIRRWAQPVPGTLDGLLRSEWESRDRIRDRRIRLDSGVAGVARGISGDGGLRVAGDDGRLFFVRAGGVRLDEPGDSAALHGPGAARGSE